MSQINSITSYCPLLSNACIRNRIQNTDEQQRRVRPNRHRLAAAAARNGVLGHAFIDWHCNSSFCFVLLWLVSIHSREKEVISNASYNLTMALLQSGDSFRQNARIEFMPIVMTPVGCRSFVRCPSQSEQLLYIKDGLTRKHQILHGHPYRPIYSIPPNNLTL